MPEYDQFRRITDQLADLRARLAGRIEEAEGRERRNVEDLHRKVSKAFADLAGR
ncbi:hypothetical protein [Pseudoruegeria sp. SHC-113]|uniref:hypothetical protein n=1 Tax=Pseudoruegeria sp. SHC-113 TaxID=2855439 RepID=UPI0021BADB36|nr:hypothetical protein [Pseudoruegeria sp. SHC-113]MCT8160685.1 hypothetical protein [Pseudoruegeria sp. SHC-113]